MHPVSVQRSLCTSTHWVWPHALRSTGGGSLWPGSICDAIPDSVNVFRVLVWVIFSTFVMESVKGYARAIHRNAVSAKIDLTFAVILVLATLALMQGMGILGYAIAVVIAPLFASIPFGMRMKLWKWEWTPMEKVYVGFWSYGLFTTLGSLLSQLFYAADVFLIGHHYGEEASLVAVYRVAVIVPLASAVLPVSIAATDYMKNALNKHDVRALRSYMVGYWKTFGTLSLVLLGLLGWFAPVILEVFGEGYVEGAKVMRIFLLGSLGAHALRVPYGHLLSAVGRADWNTYISLVLVVLTVVSLHVGHPAMGSGRRRNGHGCDALVRWLDECLHVRGVPPLTDTRCQTA